MILPEIDMVGNDVFDLVLFLSLSIAPMLLNRRATFFHLSTSFPLACELFWLDGIKYTFCKTNKKSFFCI